MSFVRDLQRNARAHGAPVSVAIIAIAVTNFLLSWVAPPAAWNTFLAFYAPFAKATPWTALTYPLAANPRDILGIFFMSYWMWVIGATVEREFGWKRFLGFFVAMTLIPALMMLVAHAAFGRSPTLYGLYLPVAGVTIAWATRWPTQQILFMLIIPIQAKWLGWLTAAFVVLGYGVPIPFIGLLAGVHLLGSYLFTANKLPNISFDPGRGKAKKQQWLPREKDDNYLRDVKKREMERAERDRLRKLFEGSIEDSEDKP
ncbi:MAG: hypothetical protein QOJ65_1967 [Fimbriimonadaceae bacterium]|jgi:membrane associated rhomboid family serine protease|nr:hypothetical protein [Fimbriimonadaceae bacterium]